jgi:putative endonuclease
MDYQFWTYIVASRSGTLYIGVTNDLYERVQNHRLGKIEGFSKKYRCNRLVYFEEYAYIQTAIAREKQLKGWRRSKKIALIEKMNPRWMDLSEHWGKEMIFPKQALSAKMS